MEKKRSVVINIIGTFFIIWGILRVLQGMGWYHKGTPTTLDRIFTISINLIVPFLLAISGVGIILMKEITRKFVIVIVSIEILIILVLTVGSGVIFLLVFVLPFIYSLIYLTRPKVKEQFK